MSPSPLPPGKLPPALLAILLAQDVPTDPRVLIGPRVGEDAAVIDMGDRLLIAKSDPITFATDAIGYYAVMVNANDIAGQHVEIPAKAVFMKDNQQYLFIEESPGQYERKLVKTGGDSEGKTLILDGIEAGQKVVTEGCLLLEALIESADKS